MRVFCLIQCTMCNQVLYQHWLRAHFIHLRLQIVCKTVVSEFWNGTNYNNKRLLYVSTTCFPPRSRTSWLCTATTIISAPTALAARPGEVDQIVFHFSDYLAGSYLPADALVHTLLGSTGNITSGAACISLLQARCWERSRTRCRPRTL